METNIDLSACRKQRLSANRYENKTDWRLIQIGQDNYFWIMNNQYNIQK